MLFSLPWLLPALAFATEAAKEQPAPKPADCRLIVEGKHIEKLTLVDEQGHATIITRPGSSVSLPAGRYWIQEICVQWDESGAPNTEKDVNWLTLDPSRPSYLNVGSSATPRVVVTQRGRTLSLNCQGVTRIVGSAPPQFAVYQGDRRIASGAFEYG